MKTITITTPDNIEIEYRLAGVGSRLAAALIDTSIQIAAFLLVALPIFIGVMGFRFSEAARFNFSGPAAALLIILSFVIFFGYYFVFEMIMNGQTPGKKIFGLRAIRENGQPIGLPHTIIRNLFRHIVDATGVGPVVMLFAKKNKRVGDMLASTVVVAERGQLTAASFGTPPPPAERPILYENFRLSAEEREWLKEYMRRRHAFLDGGVYLRSRFVSYFARKFDVPENMINEETLEKIVRLNL